MSASAPVGPALALPSGAARFLAPPPAWVGHAAPGESLGAPVGPRATPVVLGAGGPAIAGPQPLNEGARLGHHFAVRDDERPAPVDGETAVPLRDRGISARELVRTIFAVSPGAALEGADRLLTFAEGRMPVGAETGTTAGRYEVGRRVELAVAALAGEIDLLLGQAGESVVSAFGPWLVPPAGPVLEGRLLAAWRADAARVLARAESYAPPGLSDTAPPAPPDTPPPPRAIDAAEVVVAKDVGRVALPLPAHPEAGPVATLTGPPGSPAAVWPGQENRGAFSRHGATPSDPAGHAAARPEEEPPAAPGPAASPPEVLAAPSAPGPEIVSLAARAGGALLEAGLPFDLPVLRQEVDAFFARLGQLGEAGEGLRAGVRLAPWLTLLAAGAFELARRWEKRASRRAAPEDEVVLGPAALLTGEE